MARVRGHDPCGIAAFARAVFARGDAGLCERARLCCAITSATARPSPTCAFQGAFCAIGTMAASLELRSVSEFLTLRTCGAAVSSAPKAWKVFGPGPTDLRMRPI